MPSMFGILISVMMTSYRAPSILFFASCPACTVSTRCPSRRREISSISQIERSSSQTRMLATRTSGGSQRGLRRDHGVAGLFFRASLSGVHAMQSQYHRCSLSRLRTCPHLAFVRLHNLVHNREPQPGTTFEVGLKRLEDLLKLLWSHPRTRIGECDLPFLTDRLHSRT